MPFIHSSTSHCHHVKTPRHKAEGILKKTVIQQAVITSICDLMRNVMRKWSNGRGMLAARSGTVLVRRWSPWSKKTARKPEARTGQNEAGLYQPTTPAQQPGVAGLQRARLLWLGCSSRTGCLLCCSICRLTLPNNRCSIQPFS